MFKSGTMEKCYFLDLIIKENDDDVRASILYNVSVKPQEQFYIYNLKQCVALTVNYITFMARSRLSLHTVFTSDN